MQQVTQSKDHSKDMIRESDHIETIYINRKNHVFGEKHLVIFVALFFNSFMASNTINKLRQFKQYLYKNLGILHHLFLDKFPKLKIFLILLLKKFLNFYKILIIILIFLFYVLNNYVKLKFCLLIFRSFHYRSF